MRTALLAAAVVASLGACTSGPTSLDARTSAAREVTILSGGQPGTCGRTRFTYAAAEGAPTGDFECSLDNEPFFACAADGIEYIGLSYGLHVFRVRTRNSSIWAERDFVIDSALPTITVVSPAPSSATSGSLHLRLAGDWPGATLTCTLDREVLPYCDDGTDLPHLNPGFHHLAVTAHDTCGNHLQQDIFWTVVSDEEACGPPPPTCPRLPPGCGTLACGFFDGCACVDGTWQDTQRECYCLRPVATITSGAEDGVGCPRTTFRYTVREAPEDPLFSCALDAAFLSACPKEGITYEGLAPGRHLFRVAADLRGRPEGFPTERVFSVDAEPPAIAITAPDDGWTTGSTIILGLATEAGVNVRCVLDGAHLAECRDGQALPSLAPGSHQLTVLAADGCENTAMDTVTWTVAP